MEPRGGEVLGVLSLSFVQQLPVLICNCNMLQRYNMVGADQVQQELPQLKHVRLPPTGPRSAVGATSGVLATGQCLWAGQWVQVSTQRAVVVPIRGTKAMRQPMAVVMEFRQVNEAHCPCLHLLHNHEVVQVHVVVQQELNTVAIKVQVNTCDPDRHLREGRRVSGSGDQGLVGRMHPPGMGNSHMGGPMCSCTTVSQECVCVCDAQVFSSQLIAFTIIHHLSIALYPLQQCRNLRPKWLFLPLSTTARLCTSCASLPHSHPCMAPLVPQEFYTLLQAPELVNGRYPRHWHLCHTPMPFCAALDFWNLSWGW